MNGHRMRAVLNIAACVVALLGATAAQAQSFPTRPVTIIIPSPPGGVNDIIARQLAKHLEKSFRQPVIVDNKPAGGGIPAVEYVLNAPRDGHTLLQANIQQWAIAPATFKTLSFDPEKDFAGVTMIGVTEMFLVASTSLQVTDLKDLISKARTNPGKYTYGSSGVASLQHLTLEAFRVSAGLDMLHVPYRGGSQTMAALVSGEVLLAVQSWGPAKPLIDAGKLKLLAVAASARVAEAPDVPTFGEVGVPGVDVVPGLGIVTGAGVRPEVLDTLSTDFRAALSQPDVQELLRKYAFTQAVGVGPAETMAWIKADRQKLGALVRAIKLEPQ
jgi:tripartite-type tricarboxylate transporter receptor subunit TctC